LGDAGWMRSELVDKYVGSAIRPPVLELFVGDLGAWFLHMYGNTLPAIHLGDAADLSCRSELQSFEVMMAAYVGRAHVPWFFAPGNHDGYFFGNYYEDPSPGSPNTWAQACAGAKDAEASKPLLHSDVVRWVLATVARQPDEGAKELAGKLVAAEDGRGEATVANLEAIGKPPNYRMLTGVAWRIDAKDPWRSFVVQRLDLTARSQPGAEGGAPRVTAILVDTAAYTHQPQLVPLFYPNAGITGDLPSDEREVIEAWARAAHARGDVLLVMGHHNYDTLTKDAKQLIDTLHDSYGLTSYISAHTHAGRWYAHASKAGTWAELNVGSMISSPVEFRSLQIATTDAYGPKKQVALHSKLRRIEMLMSTLSAPEIPDCEVHAAQGTTAPPELWSCQPLQQPVAWEAVPRSHPDARDDPDYYVAYNEVTHGRDATRGDLLNLLLASYQRELAAVPSTATWSEGVTDHQVCEQIRDARASSDVEIKRALLVKLLREEPLRPTDRTLDRLTRLTLRDRYRVCQAIWATNADYLEGRRPKVEDSTIVIPNREDTHE
ncbi:MAG TPA: hypothetical protein VHN14_17720, partial [Kofleriaceae bacterium]|nr:hypothetical protein [Kofleriaceae bacterium]